MSSGIPGRNAGPARRPLAIDVPLVAALAAMPLIVIAANLPSPLLLPGISALAFVAAAVAATAGSLMQAEQSVDKVTIFDFAGACVLIGIAAGMFSDPHRVSQFFGAAIATP